MNQNELKEIRKALRKEHTLTLLYAALGVITGVQSHSWHGSWIFSAFLGFVVFFILFRVVPCLVTEVIRDVLFK